MTRFRTTILLLIKVEILLLAYLAFLSHSTRHDEAFINLEQYRNSNIPINFLYKKSENEVLKTFARKKTTKDSKIAFLKTFEPYKSVQSGDLEAIPFPLVSILYRNQIYGKLYQEYEQKNKQKYLRSSYKTVVESIEKTAHAVEIKLNPIEYLQIQENVSFIVDEIHIAKMPIKIHSNQNYQMIIKNPITGKIERYVGL